MGRAKEIVVKVIPAKVANEFVKKHHYSGKVFNASSIHFGCFLDGKLHGALSYGSSIRKDLLVNLVEDTKWNEFIELNRMAFDDYLPKNSESRCISISIKLIKKNAPHIKWIISFADGCQCGDGTIYRASGFKLTGIKENSEIYEIEGEKFHTMSLYDGRPTIKQREFRERTGLKTGSVKTLVKAMGGSALKGYQFRYIYLIDKTCKITVPILPFSKIDELGAGMYKGEKVSLQDRQAREV